MKDMTNEMPIKITRKRTIPKGDPKKKKGLPVPADLIDREENESSSP